ncbi:unnamed protein product [Camellia sinensis]
MFIFEILLNYETIVCFLLCSNMQVGFLYFSVVEDYFTYFINLHGKGWISVYCNPARPAFLGSGTTNLSDVLVQTTRWGSGLVEVAISRFCPLLHCPKQKEKQMSVLERMCYAELAFFPFDFIPLWLLCNHSSALSSQWHSLIP